MLVGKASQLSPVADDPVANFFWGNLPANLKSQNPGGESFPTLSSGRLARDTSMTIHQARFLSIESIVSVFASLALNLRLNLVHSIKSRFDDIIIFTHPIQVCRNERFSMCW